MVTYISGSAVANGFSLTITINCPAGIVSDDLLVAVIFGNGTSTFFAPAGWSSDGASTAGGNTIATFHKTAGGSEPASYTFTQTGGPIGSGAILAYRGSGGLDITPVYDVFAFGSSATAPTTTATRPSDKWLTVFAGADGGAFSTPTGLTARDHAQNPGNFSIYTFDKDLSSPGATGTAVSTVSPSDNGSLVSILVTTDLGWQPTWQLLVAFNNAAEDDPGLITTVATPAGTLGATNVWTDITPQVVGNIDTNRGRQHEVDRFQAGTLTALLRNDDGRFDSWNTSSPYTGKIAPGVPVRLQGTFGGVTYKEYTGVADVWATEWTGENSSRVALSCVDQFSYFNYALCNDSGYATKVLADGAAGYWPLNDPTGATYAADASGNADNLTVVIQNGAVAFGQPGRNLGDGRTSVTFTGAVATLALTVPPWPHSRFADATGSIEFWLNCAGGVAPAVAFSITGDDTSSFQVSLLSATTINGYCDGQWHHFIFTWDGGTVLAFADGVSVPALATGTYVQTSISGGAGSYIQAISAGNPTFSLQDVAFYDTRVGATAAAHYALGRTPPQETSGARVNRMLDWASWPTAARNVDTGNSQVQAVTSSIATTSVLSYLQTVELSEYGALFMDSSGKVRFMSRGTVLSENQLVGAVATFGDGGGAEIPFELNPQIARDTLDLYTAVSLQRVGGVLQTAGSGLRTYSQTSLLNTSDQEVSNYANWLATNLSSTVPRIRNITVHPYVDPSGAATIALLGLELMQVVTVNRHKVPGGGTAFSQTAFVEGINHHIYPATGDWTVDLQLAPVQLPVWILGTSQLGVDTRLAF